MPTVSRSAIKERVKDFAVRTRARVYAVAGWLWSQRAKLQRLNASVGWVRRNAFVLLGLVGLVALVAVVLLATPAPGWFPGVGDTGALLGALLGAQAAIAALTLAVTLFVMQGISARVDVDERMYREYIHRAWVWPIFWISLATVGVTGLVLLTQQFSSRAPAALDAMPGLPNLTLFAAVAFLANLVLAGVLFRRALHQNSPEQWRALRLDVNKRDVRESVAAYLSRLRRAVTAQEADEPDWSIMFPDPEEGSADEAVQNLLDDARRAMDERRLVYFKSSLESVRDLVTYAMDEIEQEGLSWSQPGEQPQWPPVLELWRRLYAFREDIIGRGDREYIFELLSLDYWLFINGVRRQCGELFTVALDGYRRNYEIARRSDSDELRELLRDRLWSVADGAILPSPLDEIQSYVNEMVRHQARLLAHAMEAELPGDYEGLHKAFGSVLRAVDLHRDNPPGPWGESAALSVKLEQDYRIALMGLGGRALFLTESAKLTDPIAYVALTRDECGDLEQLAGDIAQALVRGDQWSSSLWSQWESEGYGSYEVHSMQPEQYPLAFFLPAPARTRHRGYADAQSAWARKGGAGLVRDALAPVRELPESVPGRERREAARTCPRRIA